jgi:hypothetical protein
VSAPRFFYFLLIGHMQKFTDVEHYLPFPTDIRLDADSRG